MKIPFKGCATALITPMKGHAVDYSALTYLIERQIKGGVGALVVCGTTGEGSTLGCEEKLKITAHAKKQAEGKAVVITGCSSGSTRGLAEFAKKAERAGADALLCLTPYYNKASREGVYLHYKTVCEGVSLPVIAYNIPQRTGLSIEVEDYERLALVKNFCGVKEASGSLSYGARVKSRIGQDLCLYSGNDELITAMYAIGGEGVISVLSNIVPERVAKLCRKWEEGDHLGAVRDQLSLMPLIEALFCEVNPIPVKTALNMMGLCTEEMRLPLCPLSETKKKRLRELLEKEKIV